MKFLDEHEALERIRSELASSGDARLAVAFWGAGASVALGIAQRPAPTQIVCNLTTGGTNPEEIARLRRTSALIRHTDRLHAKVYLFDDVAIVGSSNASANGLSFSPGTPGWLEANVLIEEPAELVRISRWFGNLPARDVSDDDLVRAELTWRRRRRGLPPALQEPGALVHALLSTPAAVAGRSLYLVVYRDDLSPAGRAGVKYAQTEWGEHIEAFEGWPELPKDGLLFCFDRSANGSLRFDGIWERKPPVSECRLPGGATLQLCWLAPDYKDYAISGRELRPWQRLCDRLVRSPRFDRASGCGFVEFDALSEMPDFPEHLALTSLGLTPGTLVAGRYLRAMEGPANGVRWWVSFASPRKFGTPPAHAQFGVKLLKDGKRWASRLEQIDGILPRGGNTYFIAVPLTELGLPEESALLAARDRFASVFSSLNG